MSDPMHPPLNPSARPIERLGLRYLWGWTPRDFVELFILGNLAFLGFDILLAHSYNHFGIHSLHLYAQWAEWVPICFSILAPLFLLAAIATGGLAPNRGVSRETGLIIGWCAIVIGISGLVFHLNSQFFELRTLKSLVYTAPFAAPLSYAGLGLLLIMNRMVDGESAEWAGWVLLLTAGGFLGNFILSVADHAINAFFVWTEWIPVVASALAFTFLVTGLLMETGMAFLRICAGVLVLQALVGLLGFALHLWFNLHLGTSDLREQLVNRAPAFAPLLFTNLAVLGGLGIWASAISRRGVT